MPTPLNTETYTEGVSTTTNTSRSVPGVYSPQQLKDQVAGYTESLKQLTEALVGADKLQQDATKAAANATAAAGLAKADTIRAEGQAASAKAEVDAAARATMGTDLRDPNSDMVRFAAERHDRWKAMDQLKQEITRSENVSFTDDPLGFLVNTLRVPMLKREFNQQEALQTELNNRVTVIENQTMLAQNIDTGITPRTAQAIADKKAAEALAVSAAQAQEVLARGASLHAQTLMQQAALADKPMAAMMDLAKMTATHTGTSTTTTQRATESARDPAGAKLDQTTVDAINMKLRAAGANEAQLYSVPEYKQLDQKTRSELIKYAKMPGFGSDPGDSIKFLSDRGLLNDNLRVTNPALAQTLTIARGDPEYARARDTLSKNPSWAKLDPIQQEGLLLNTAVETTMKRYLSGDARSHLAIPPTSPLAFRPIFAAQQPELEGNWVTKYIKDRVAADRLLLTRIGGITPQDIANEALGRALVARQNGDGAAIKKIAAETANFFRQGQLTQWAKSGAAALGYPRPTEFAAGGLQNNDTGRAIQFWSAPEVEHWLMFQAAKQTGLSANFNPRNTR